MREYALVKGEVAMVVRKDHFGDPFYWLLCSMNPNASPRLFYANADWCVLLDPALNILFERNEHE